MTRFQPSTLGGRARRAVASYSSYRDAEGAVDYLADRNFPVEHVAIVGRDIKFVEQVTGRTSWGDAALKGVLTGGIVGLLIGWLFWAFNWFDPIVTPGWLVFDGLWFGVVVGGLFGLAVHAITRGRRDFASFPTLQAERFEVLVDDELADEAARLLDRSGERTVSTEPGDGVGRRPVPTTG